MGMLALASNLSLLPLFSALLINSDVKQQWRLCQILDCHSIVTGYTIGMPSYFRDLKRMNILISSYIFVFFSIKITSF